ncbi:MAG: NifB/NifX family molybdenum-iron cluster-binding protein [Melioribacteraceae bacterium]|nr:NifB/NifX family molybdenum-iron cluster-binding protein [Melioribacteraceae bacterium]
MNRRIAVAIEEKNSGVEHVAEHFGRCSKIIICELGENNEIIKKEVYHNPLNGHHGGVCQLPAYISQYGIQVIIAGGMGAKAVANFHSYGIDVITAPGLEYEYALEKFRSGNLSGYEECAGHSHDC